MVEQFVPAVVAPEPGQPDPVTATAPVAEVAPVASPDLPPPTPIRSLPKRTVSITLPEPYQDFHVTAWVNFPQKMLNDMQALAKKARIAAKAAEDADGDTDAPVDDETQSGIAVLLRQIVLGHDLVDFDGQSYPPATDPTLYDVIPTELMVVVLREIIGQVGKLPKAKSAS